MKLVEITFATPQDELNFQTRKMLFTDPTLSLGKLIVSQYKKGKISYEEARQRLIDNKLHTWLPELENETIK